MLALVTSPLETPAGEYIFAGMPELDVVILNWNGLHFLKLFLPVLIRYTPADQANIVIADNGSSDESLIWLADNYARRVKIIPFEKTTVLPEDTIRLLNSSRVNML